MISVSWKASCLKWERKNTVKVERKRKYKKNGMLKQDEIKKIIKNSKKKSKIKTSIWMDIQGVGGATRSKQSSMKK